MQKFAHHFLLVSALVSVLFYSVPAAAQQKMPPEFSNWLPITAEERQMQSPVIDKDAGAEVLLWRVHVVDDFLGPDLQRVFYHYVRVKVFDAKGKQQVGTVDLPYTNSAQVLDVAGRTIKADGSIVELDKKMIFKRDLVRAGGLKQKVCDARRRRGRHI